MYKLSDVRRKRLITELDWDILYTLASVFVILVYLNWG